MSEERLFRNYQARQRAKDEMWAADRAVRAWRDNQDPSGFLDLRLYLATKTSFGKWEDYSVSGWGCVLSPALTAQEYAAMKAAWLETEAGKACTWRIESDWL